ncbi:MAG: GTPase Era [Saprospiraceae bacterium]|nr:GTPase Era [Saprospiraceae bacterium]
MTLHRAGFVSIIGMPNSGKSTLVNAFMGQKMSIVSPKPQTTRQRVFSIWNEEDIQVIYSDLPGWIEDEKYTMHKLMNDMLRESEEDSDLLLILHDPTQKYKFSENLIELVLKSKLPKILLINKIDKLDPNTLRKYEEDLKLIYSVDKVFSVSAMHNAGIDELQKEILKHIPEHEAYYDKDYISDKPIRFFLSEIIREKILDSYMEEIPYSVFIEITSCTGVDDQLELARIEATIYVNRKSQVAIMLGKNGDKIKDLGIKSRLEMEKYLNQRVYLGLSVKVKENWREDKSYIEKKGILR